MKKYILLCLIAIGLFSSSCTDEHYYDYPNIYTKTFVVNHNMWQSASDDTGDYLYCTFNESKLTQNVMNNGLMLSYLYYKPSGLNESVMSPLPFSDFIVERDANGDVTFKSEEHFTVEYAVGSVTFILKVDDHYIGNEVPYYDSYEFALKLAW